MSHKLNIPMYKEFEFASVDFHIFNDYASTPFFSFVAAFENETCFLEINWCGQVTVYANSSDYTYDEGNEEYRFKFNEKNYSIGDDLGYLYEDLEINRLGIAHDNSLEDLKALYEDGDVPQEIMEEFESVKEAAEDIIPMKQAFAEWFDNNEVTFRYVKDTLYLLNNENHRWFGAQ